MRILYSFNKKGFEADYWTREIAAASDAGHTFLPFNHGGYVDPYTIVRAQALDDAYYEERPGLMRLYADFEARVRELSVDAVIVDNVLPYHPEFLRRLDVHKVMRTSDGPLSAYDRDFAYVHAYDQVLYHSPAYSRDLGMEEKLRYVGAKRADFWPLALFDAVWDTSQTEETILAHERDVDVVFVGALFVGKMPLIARVKKAFGRRCRVYGLTTVKRNLYYNARFGFPGWVRPLPFEEYVPLYQRAKIGFNVHNRGDYTVGGYRLFELPANGVMQISDGGEYLSSFYEVGKEIVGYREADDLIDKIRYYLEHDDERRRIAQAGFRAVTGRHRIRDRLHQAAALIEEAMGRG
jgi:spore maturation protein CgeB